MALQGYDPLAHHFFHERPSAVPRLGTLSFYCAPTAWNVDREEPHLTVTTLGGAGQFRYPGKPAVYTMNGHTSLAGLDGPGGIEQIRSHLASRQGVVGTVQPYIHPSQFRGVVYVRVNRMQESVDGSSDMSLYYFYTLELEETPLRQAGPAVRVSSTPAIDIEMQTTLSAQTSTAATKSPGAGLVLPRGPVQITG